MSWQLGRSAVTATAPLYVVFGATYVASIAFALLLRAGRFLRALACGQIVLDLAIAAAVEIRARGARTPAPGARRRHHGGAGRRSCRRGGVHQRAPGPVVKTRLTGPARRQADRIDRRWRENRAAARDPFARELAEARALLEETPELGTPYTERQGVLVRRILLPGTHQHVYHEVDRERGAVMILAVWGAPRGRAPKL